jgi:hypothetical protein
MKSTALLSALLPCVLSLTLVGAAVVAVPADRGTSGMVWERHGAWHLNGSSDVLRLGESIPPGGLITGSSDGSAHSIVIFLPDGQRMLCECYDTETCSQGFRVPLINPPPQPAVWEMFVAIRDVLLLRPAKAERAFPPPVGREEQAINSEMVAGINPQGEISIASALRVLPSGRYSLRVASDEQTAAATAPVIQPLNWQAPQKVAQVRVGRTGLYRIRVSDQSNAPRFEIEVLATSPASLATEGAGLKFARETILQWTHAGWPLHSLLRVYLESRLLAASR